MKPKPLSMKNKTLPPPGGQLKSPNSKEYNILNKKILELQNIIADIKLK